MQRRAEGISVGIWVRRGLLRTLEATAKGPATLLDLSERMGVLEARLSVLEKSHRALHQSVHATDRPTTNGASEQRKMASHQEIEVKLRADPEKIAKIRRSRWWRELEPISRQSLHSIYFDTSDRQLRDSNISLRTRADGHSIVQTVKLLNGASNSVSRREWETLVPDPIPDPSLVIDPTLPQEFRKLTSADLQPMFDVDVKRETRRLTSDRAKIDVSLDNGAVIAGDDRKPVHEIELELVAGEFADLFAEAQRLSDAVDGRLHARTKADVGYALNRADRRHWSRAPKLHLTPDMTAGESFQLSSAAHSPISPRTTTAPGSISTSKACTNAALRCGACVPHSRSTGRCCAASASSRSRTECAGSENSSGRPAISMSCRPNCSSPPAKRWERRSSWLR